MAGVCPQPGCPNLNPCPVHARQTNTTRNPNRDRAAHQRWARAVKLRDRHQCQRCGSTHNLDAHHLRPGYQLHDGVTLCNACHVLVDPHARKR